MNLARSVLLVALVVGVGVSLAVMFFLCNSTRENEEPMVTRPVETTTATLKTDEINSVAQIVDLLESESRVGSEIKAIFSPTYLPEGFTPEDSIFPSDPYFGSGYTNASGDLHLFIAREPFYGRPEIEQGHVEEVTVSGQIAYLLRGGWITIVRDEQADPVEYWDSELSLTIFLNLGDGWFTITVLPYSKEHGLDERELLRVAESMRPVSERQE